MKPKKFKCLVKKVELVIEIKLKTTTLSEKRFKRDIARLKLW